MRTREREYVHEGDLLSNRSDVYHTSGPGGPNRDRTDGGQCRQKEQPLPIRATNCRSRCELTYGPVGSGSSSLAGGGEGAV